LERCAPGKREGRSGGDRSTANMVEEEEEEGVEEERGQPASQLI
jgi:hypothetical protein